MKSTDFSNMIIICKEGHEWVWTGSVKLDNTEMYAQPKRWRMRVIRRMLKPKSLWQRITNKIRKRGKK